MSIRGMVFRGLGVLVGGKVAEETGNSGALGGILGFGLTALARRSPLGLVTVGGLYLGKKYLDAKAARDAQPTLPLTGVVPAEAATPTDLAAAADARDPMLAASA